jgi:sulfate adenylyltransferase subunit 2
MSQCSLSHLKELEAEAIFVIREVAAQFERPALLFSGGKDSILVSYLSNKAFYPLRIPFPLLHIDTGHNFPETIEFRNRFVNDLGVQLIVGSVQESIDCGRVIEEKGLNANRNGLQTITLLDSIEVHQIDAALGGARREEEKARAKERFFSHRDEFGQWDPKNQRPELWNLFNGRKRIGEHFRIFPISNWTELDVWQYFKAENIPLPKLYFAHEREVIIRNKVILSASPWLKLKPGEKPVIKRVRFRTCGDMPITGAIESNADTIDKIIAEIDASTKAERGTREDDKRSETAMEDRKRLGYF